MRYLYKLVSGHEWAEFLTAGVFMGSAVDLADGFIHFSYADQLPETARKHFSGKGDLVVFAVDPDVVKHTLRDEVSRGGQLFPHLYAALDMRDVLWHKPVALDAQGVPILPPL